MTFEKWDVGTCALEAVLQPADQTAPCIVGIELHHAGVDVIVLLSIQPSPQLGLALVVAVVGLLHFLALSLSA